MKGGELEKLGIGEKLEFEAKNWDFFIFFYIWGLICKMRKSFGIFKGFSLNNVGFQSFARKKPSLMNLMNDKQANDFVDKFVILPNQKIDQFLIFVISISSKKKKTKLSLSNLIVF